MAKAQETIQGMTEKATEKGREVGSQVLQRADQMTSAPVRMGEQMPSKLYIGAVVGSIVASAGLFLAGRTQAGIFVGLWAPTILNLGLFNKLLRPSRESMSGQGGGSYGASGTYGSTAAAASGQPF